MIESVLVVSSLERGIYMYVFPACQRVLLAVLLVVMYFLVCSKLAALI